MSVPSKPLRHRKIGAYRVLGELGRGGMAQVYHGIHEALQREVAIKEMLADPLRDKEAVSRFRREALALAAFHHQNIVTLYDMVEKNDVLFMVMEYVDGPTLQELVRESPLPPDVAAVIGSRIAGALEHAHFRHVIHRDLKPANVMLKRSGELKLMDFGIAKDVGLETLTAEGLAVGTPPYMSPEQVTGAPVDRRTDLFSLGVLLYEALSGTRPFQGDNTGQLFARIREGKYVPLNKVAPHVPKPLVEIVKRALKVKPEARFHDAAAMGRALDVFLARELDTSPEALVVGFLRQRQRITETEALVHLTPAELEALESAVQPVGASRRWRWWAAGLGLATGGGAGLYATQAQWLPLVQQWLPSVQQWLPLVRQ